MWEEFTRCLEHECYESSCNMSVKSAGVGPKHLPSSLADRGMASPNSSLDSKEVWTSTCKSLGISDDDLAKLAAANVDTMGALAFAAPLPMNGTAADEGKLVDFLKLALGAEPNAVKLVPYRRLWWECSMRAMGEMKARIERTDSAEPVKVPLVERTARLAEQKRRLTGITYTPEIEPSHKLVDMVFQMAADQVISWIPWEKLTSRAGEVAQTQTELSIKFEASGNLRLQKKQMDGQCSLNGDLQIRQALMRRSLAFDMARLCSFEKMEAYVDQLFQLMLRDPPPGCTYISLSQVRDADRFLFTRLSELTRGGVTMLSDGTKPVEAQLVALQDHPQVQHHLIPLPKANRFSPYEEGKGVKGKPGVPKGGKAAGGKGGKKGKGKDGDMPPAVQLPPGCSSQTTDGKRLCFPFNQSSCKFAKDGRRCRRGFHLCWRCFQPHSHVSCPLPAPTAA